VICIEGLNVRAMMSNHTLARAIEGASWATFRRLLEYRCEWYGRDLIAIDRFRPSSKICSECGSLRAAITLGERTFKCPDKTCGHSEDRDVNAAKNILAAGLAVAACGDGVRRKRS
jgi:putative transposase